jgi:hypothetical protein
MRFLFVEYPEVTPVAMLTRGRPGLTIDVITEPGTGPMGRRRFRIILLARGSKSDVDAVAKVIEASRGPLEVLNGDPRGERWLVRFVVREEDLTDSVSQRLTKFQDRYGAPWLHMDDGQMYLRARVHDDVDSERLVAEVRAELGRLMPASRKGDVGGQVEVRELGPRDYGVWQELIQFAIGLA